MYLSNEGDGSRGEITMRNILRVPIRAISTQTIV
jgi:hypothetical protein